MNLNKNNLNNKNKMWCAYNNCNCYDKENDKCNRIGTNNNVGICWMSKGEGEY